MSWLSPFLPGDIFVTATVLDPQARYPTGRGRIKQLSSRFEERGYCWTADSGLISCLRLLEDGHLVALDPQARDICCFAPNGQSAPIFEGLEQRGYGSLMDLGGGEYLIGEHLCGPEGSPFAGEGKVYRCTRDGGIIDVYETETNGGMGGFLGVTHMALSEDGATLYHLSETGPVVYAHDLKANKRLGVVYESADNPPLLFGLACVPGGDLIVMTGGGAVRIDGDGHVQAKIAAEHGRGWSVIEARPDGQTYWACDFFGGWVGQIDPQDNTLAIERDLGLPKALAGIAEIGV